MSVLIAVSMLAFAQSENVGYANWKDCRVGSWSALKGEVVSKGVTYQMEYSYTLKELTPDKAVIDMSSKSTSGGKTVTSPTTQMVLNAGASRQGAIDQEGDETIEVAGQKLKCHWIQGTVKEGRDKGTKIKSWMSSEIPGGIARIENAYPDARGTTKFTASEWFKR